MRLYGEESGIVSTIRTTHQDPTTGLLRRFQDSRDPVAFRELVQHYGGLVEGTARRLLPGDPEAARDVAQRVFMDLAQKAPQLAPDSQLGGWLHRHTVFLASHHGKADQRRRRREREAAHRLAMEEAGEDFDGKRVAEVHAALGRLPEEDRTALILRYWENRPLRAVGDVLGIGEDAAQKRVSRALDRLRSRLGAGGGGLGLAALGHGLTVIPTAEAAAPAWAAAVAARALDPAVAPAASGFLTISTWQAGWIGAGVAAGICCTVFIPEIRSLRQAMEEARMTTPLVLPVMDQTSPAPPSPSPAEPVANADLVARIRQLEARLEAKTARDQMVMANLKRARERADRDRQTFSADGLTALESAYQLAKQEPDVERHAAALRSLLEKFRHSNRAGCAVLRLARLTTGPGREQWLEEAIAHHSDAYYLDGTSVGAMARLYLAAEWAQRGRQTDAARLRQEIESLFPDATDHDGLPVMEALRSSTRPD